MKFVCEECQAKYQIGDDKVAGAHASYEMPEVRPYHPTDGDQVARLLQALRRSPKLRGAWLKLPAPTWRQPQRPPQRRPPHQLHLLSARDPLASFRNRYRKRTWTIRTRTSPRPRFDQCRCSV